MSPFETRRTKFHEFCLITNRLIDYNKREEKKTHHGKQKKRAGDNWF